MAHCQGIVEIPGGRFLGRRDGGRSCGSLVLTELGTVFLELLFRIGSLLCPSLFLLFLLQSRDDAVYGGIAFCLGKFGESLQGVLQLHGIRVGHQFVEHHRPFRQGFIVLAVFVE